MQRAIFARRFRLGELHRRGDEAARWIDLHIDPVRIALRLWHQTRGILPTWQPRSEDPKIDASMKKQNEVPLNLRGPSGPSPPS
jgi:hypothetical protein